MKKYLSLYKQAIRLGRLPKRGLCNCLKRKAFTVNSELEINYWDLLPKELKLLLPEDSQLTYWGHEWCASNPMAEIPTHMKNEIHYELTPLRQNIILFCAAMAEEL